MIDLTINIENNMQVYPSDPNTIIKKCFSYEDDGCLVNNISFSSHCGTHIDFPSHFIKGGKNADDYKIDDFIGKGFVIDISYKTDNEIIYVKDISKYEEDILKTDVLIFKTGYSKYYNTDRYLKHPYLDIETVKYLCNKDIKICGIDCFGFDATFEDKGFDAHNIFLSNGVLLVENLTGLNKLVSGVTYDFYFIPLKLKGLEACPIRAFVKE